MHKLKKLLATLLVFNFVGLQIISSALAVNITSITTVQASITPTLTGFTLSAPSVALGAAAPTITAPTPSIVTGRITYSSNNTGVATIDSVTGVIALVAAGTTTFTASQPALLNASGNYLAASATQNLTVTATTPTVKTAFALTPSSVIYDSNTIPAITPPVTDNTSGAITYAVTGGTSTTPAVIDPGTGKINSIGSVGTTIFTATQAANGNYARNTTSTTLTVTAASPNLSGPGLNFKSVKLTGNAPTITTPISNSSGEFSYSSSNLKVATIDPTSGIISLQGLGTTTITAIQAPAGNYSEGSITSDLKVID